MNPVLKRTLTGIAIGLVVLLAIVFSPLWVFPWVIGVLAILAYVEFVQLLRMKSGVSPVKRAVLLLAGLVIIAGGLSALTSVAFTYGNLMLLYVVMVVKFSDVGGFAFGLYSAKHMKGGNHKMCPSISPGKSWEGMAGSIFASCLVALLWTGATHYPIVKSLLIGFAAATVGTAGDLIESKFKRWIGVKDSSAFEFTNGMGGFLDMLDSLLFAPAVLLVLMKLNIG